MDKGNLILSRKPNEAVMVGDVEVYVAAIRKNGSVRLGFRGPKTVPIHRKEVYDRISNGDTEIE